MCILKLIIVILCFLFFISLFVLTCTPFVNKLSQNYAKRVQSVKLEKSDAIVVLGGGIYKDGTLGMYTMDRLIGALMLFKQGWAKCFVICAGPSVYKDINEGDKMVKVAKTLGFSSENILLENKSKSTYEGVLFLKDIFEKRKIKRIILVTSALHMPRVLLHFSQLNKSAVEIIPYTVDNFELYSDGFLGRAILSIHFFYEFIAYYVEKSSSNNKTNKLLIMLKPLAVKIIN